MLKHFWRSGNHVCTIEAKSPRAAGMGIPDVVEEWKDNDRRSNGVIRPGLTWLGECILEVSHPAPYCGRAQVRR